MMPLLRSAIGSKPREVNLNMLPSDEKINCPLLVMQNGCMKLLWDFTVQTDRHLTHNRPDLISTDFIRKRIL